MGALLELVVVAEDLGEIALHELAQAIDGDHVEAAAGFQPLAGIMEVETESLLTDLGGDVAGDEIEAQGGIDMPEAIAQVSAGIGQAIEPGVEVTELDGDEVLVHHQGPARGGEGCQGQANGAIAAAQIQAIVRRFHLDLLQQQPGTLVDLARGKEPPGTVEDEGATDELGLEDDVLPQLVELLSGQHGFSLKGHRLFSQKLIPAGPLAAT